MNERTNEELDGWLDCWMDQWTIESLSVKLRKLIVGILFINI